MWERTSVSAISGRWIIINSYERKKHHLLWTLAGTSGPRTLREQGCSQAGRL